MNSKNGIIVSMKKILICGGHPTPALAVVDEFRQMKPEVELVFVGRKYAIETERTLSFEYKACQGRGVRFLELQAGRITRALSQSSLLNFFRVPLGFFQAFHILLQEKPDTIISFGGYLALPIALWGWFFGKKVITHEQTMCPGSANRIIGHFSQNIFVAFEQTLRFFPRSKAQWIGNPVRKTISNTGPLPFPFPFPTDLPVVYITGGSLGSHCINKHIFAILPRLLTFCSVIHQTGDVKEYGDYDTACKLQKNGSAGAKGVYVPMKHVLDNEIGKVYNSASCVIARSGANTFFELITLKKPAILIPLPWSAKGEQKAHALFFVKHHIGMLFDQNASSDELYALVEEMIQSLDYYKKNFSALPFELKHNAAQTIVAESLR